MSSLVRPEFGPTLPQIAGPHWRRLPRWARIGLAVGAVLLVIAIVLVARSGAEPRDTIVVRSPLAFNVVYQADKLDRIAPVAGDELRLRSPASTAAPALVTVRPVRLPPYTGDPAGTLPVFASGLITEMRRADPNFILRSEGRARVNGQPGYQIQFQTTQNGHTVYGRRALLFEDKPGVRDGADITLLATRSPTIPNVDGVGSNGPTKLVYRSFRLGTERP
ncbi:MAG TPA: hypothetical protein VII98_04205 [Solirubrobacteraceae bacterium]